MPNTDERLVLYYMATEGDPLEFDDGMTVTVVLKGMTATATYSVS